jgi:hypothetical protein
MIVLIFKLKQTVSLKNKIHISDNFLKLLESPPYPPSDSWTHSFLLPSQLSEQIASDNPEFNLIKEKYADWALDRIIIRDINTLELILEFIYNFDSVGGMLDYLQRQVDSINIEQFMKDNNIETTQIINYSKYNADSLYDVVIKADGIYGDKAYVYMDRDWLKVLVSRYRSRKEDYDDEIR